MPSDAQLMNRRHPRRAGRRDIVIIFTPRASRKPQFALVSPFSI
jgi:hypothetical protein